MDGKKVFNLTDYQVNFENYSVHLEENPEITYQLVRSIGNQNIRQRHSLKFTNLLSMDISHEFVNSDEVVPYIKGEFGSMWMK